MKRVFEVGEYLMICVLLSIVGVIPMVLLVMSYVSDINTNDSEILMSRIDLWFYLVHNVKGMQTIMLSLPILITIFCNTKFHQFLNQLENDFDIEGRKNGQMIARQIVKSWIKSGLFIFMFLTLVYIITVIAPTSDDSNFLDMSFVKGRVVFTYVIINYFLLSLLFSNIGILVSYYVRKFILVIFFSQLIFSLLTLVLYMVGVTLYKFTGVESIANTFYLPNATMLDSVVSYIYVTIIITLLVSGSILINVRLYRKGMKTRNVQRK